MDTTVSTVAYSLYARAKDFIIKREITISVHDLILNQFNAYAMLFSRLEYPPESPVYNLSCIVSRVAFKFKSYLRKISFL